MDYPLSVIPSLKQKPHVIEDEARLIWTVAKTDHVYMLIKTLWYTGLRISEALNLKSKDLEISGYNYTLMVISEKKRRKGKRIINTATSRLPIASDFGEELRRYILSKKLKPSEKLFPAHRSTYWRQIRACARDANITNWQLVHPHSFRHGFVYYKASQGIHPYVLSKLARHDDIRTTLGYYEPSENDLRQAMEK